MADEFRAVLAAAGERIGVPVHDARLLRLHSNAIFLLPSAGLVIRIATNPAALPGVAASVRATQWLTGRGFPCVVPAGVGAQPLVVQGRAVSAWEYLAVVAEPAPTGADLGRLLRNLHDQPAPPEPLPPFTDPFDSVPAAIGEAASALSHEDGDWLTRRIGQLRAQWDGMDFPHPPGLIHGDAHPGNLMRTPDGAIILGDWDHLAIGPREWDLAQIYYTQRRFGRPRETDLGRFAEAYEWEPRSWPGLPTMIATREITGLSSYIRTAATKPFSRRELGRRLDSLRAGVTTAQWNTPPAE